MSAIEKESQLLLPVLATWQVKAQKAYYKIYQLVMADPQISFFHKCTSLKVLFEAKVYDITKIYKKNDEDDVVELQGIYQVLRMAKKIAVLKKNVSFFSPLAPLLQRFEAGDLTPYKGEDTDYDFEPLDYDLEVAQGELQESPFSWFNYLPTHFGHGHGLTTFGKCMSVINTGCSFLQGMYAPPFDYGTTVSAQIQNKLRTPGIPTSNIVMGRFLYVFKKTFDHIVIEDPISFCYPDGESYEDLIQRFEKTFDPKKNYIIQGVIVPPPHTWTLQIDHSVFFVLRGNDRYYFDSKAKPLQERVFGAPDSKYCLSFVLKELQRVYGLSFQVNQDVHQMDSHHCGAFGMLFLLLVVGMGKKMDDFPKGVIDVSLMDKFRRALADDLWRFERVEKALESQPGELAEIKGALAFPNVYAFIHRDLGIL